MASTSMPSTSVLDTNQRAMGDTRKKTSAIETVCYCTLHEDSAHKEPLSPTPEQSSSGCQWSTEEHILEHQFVAAALKQEHTPCYPEMTDRSFLHHEPYFYEYECTFPNSPIHHSPTVGHNFGRHRGKLGSDPTFILSLVRWARIGSSQLAGDDDQIDRLNYQITGLILLILIALTGMRQYLSNLPLQCWIPQEFSRSWEEYAENYCWVTNTYYSNLQSRLPPPEERQNVVRYYQWATFVLAVQAAGFYLPCIVWRLLQNYSGFQIQRIMKSAMQVSCSPIASVTASVSGLARYMDTVIYRRQYKLWQRPASFIHLFEPTSYYKFSPVKEPTSSVKTVQFKSAPVQRTGFKRDQATEDPQSFGKTTLRSYKKAPAPPPPVQSQKQVIKQIGSCSKPTTASINIQAKRKPDRRKDKLASSGFCHVCHFCFSSNHVERKTSVHCENIKGKTVQTTKLLETTAVTKQGEDKQGHFQSSSCSRPRMTYCPIRCWSCRNEKRNTQSRLSEQPNIKHYTSRDGGFIKRKQKNERWITRLSHICRLSGNGLLVVIRLLLTFICLIPGCLFHWMRGSQGIKCIQRSSSFLFYLYTTIKLLYLFNVIGQLCFLKYFLGTESYLFGLHVLNDLINGRPWTQTGNFPRVTYCDFEAKKTGKNYKYTLQCVLPLNLFLEKVYVFLWFWFLFVAMLTTYSLFKWLYRLSIPHRRRTFIHKFLIPWKFPYGCEKVNKHLFNVFVDKYLDSNGVFLLWLISMNASELVAGELISALWDLFWARICFMTSILPTQGFPVQEFGENANRGFEESSSSSQTTNRMPPYGLSVLLQSEGKWYSTGHLPNAISTGSLIDIETPILKAEPAVITPIPVSPMPRRATSGSLIVPAVLINQSTDNPSAKASVVDSSLDSIV
uniref:Innexin n=1 Tax=Cryptocotyle lingua TaxID=66766 RepID=A0A7U0YF41_9TREM|nr:innexin 1 [Cryptocotyle lingua]